jgi:hypothetical protein
MWGRQVQGKVSNGLLTLRGPLQQEEGRIQMVGREETEKRQGGYKWCVGRILLEVVWINMGSWEETNGSPVGYTKEAGRM